MGIETVHSIGSALQDTSGDMCSPIITLRTSTLGKGTLWCGFFLPLKIFLKNSI